MGEEEDEGGERIARGWTRIESKVVLWVTFKGEAQIRATNNSAKTCTRPMFRKKTSLME